MFDSDTTVEGEFPEQPLLVKLGCVVLYLVILAFTGFLPAAIGVAVIFQVGKPAPHWLGYVGAFGILAGFVAMGAWMSTRLLGAMSGGRLSVGARLAAFFSLLLGFVLIAAITLAFAQFSTLLVVLFAIIVGGAILAGVLINLGKSIARLIK